MRYLLGICVVCAAFFAAPISASAADPETAEPTARQVDLNARAVEAIENGQYSLAINRLEESLEAGSLNITYLNLGRAYQLMGRCRQAIDAYERVEAAPHVPQPEHALIQQKTTKYLEETRQTCEQGRALEGTGEASSGGVRIVVREEPANLKPWAWAATSTGVALVLTSAGLHLGARSIRSDLEATERNESGQVTGVTQQEAFERTSRANTLDTAALSTGIVGGVFTAVGVYLFVTDASQETEANTQISFAPRRGGFGIVFTRSF